MKRILLLLCSVSMLLLVTAPALFSQTQEQPLGDVARLARRVTALIGAVDRGRDGR